MPRHSPSHRSPRAPAASTAWRVLARAARPVVPGGAGGAVVAEDVADGDRSADLADHGVRAGWSIERLLRNEPTVVPRA